MRYSVDRKNQHIDEAKWVKHVRISLVHEMILISISGQSMPCHEEVSRGEHIAHTIWMITGFKLAGAGEESLRTFGPDQTSLHA